MLRWLLPRRVLPWPQQLKHPSPSPSPNQDRGDGVKTLVDVLRDDTQPQPMIDKNAQHTDSKTQLEYMGPQMG